MKKRVKQSKHTFQIESLIDPKGEYIGVFCAMTGELLHHTGNDAKTAQEIETEELIAEIKNPKQISLF